VPTAWTLGISFRSTKPPELLNESHVDHGAGVVAVTLGPTKPIGKRVGILLTGPESDSCLSFTTTAISKILSEMYWLDEWK
jgi:hypothetical protein